MGIWAASVRRWVADLVAGHGLDDGAILLPGRPLTDQAGSAGGSTDGVADDA